MPRDRADLLAAIASGGERLRRRRRARFTISTGAMALVVLAGVAVAYQSDQRRVDLAVGDQPTASSDATSTRQPPVAGDLPEAAELPQSDVALHPPPVTVTGTRTVALTASSYCWSEMDPSPDSRSGGRGVCADGLPPTNPPDIGEPDEVIVRFPVPGWKFEARFVATGAAECARSQYVPLIARDSTTFVLPPAGAAGDYDISLDGRNASPATVPPGPEPRGDLAVHFRWHMTRPGPLAKPTTRFSMLAGTLDAPVSSGGEFAIDNLRSTPAKATAAVEIVPAVGTPTVIDFRREQQGCIPDGSLRFSGDKDAALAAIERGRGPYRYVVTVVLDGNRYQANATWPTDVNPACSPCVPLRFEPPLPALGPAP